MEVSSAQVSRAAVEVDSELEKWRERPLGEYPCRFLDAYYEQVRRLAVLVAVGQPSRETRVSLSLSEREVHWRSFLESLKKRGLGGITSDDHVGLRAARLAVFGGIPWQRCQFHWQQSVHAYVPYKDMQTEVTEDIRTIFNAPDRTTAEAYLARTILKYEKNASRLSDWLAHPDDEHFDRSFRLRAVSPQLTSCPPSH